MRVVAIVQARMGSTRLPGKVLEPLCGRPMIAHVVERASRIGRIDELVVAIPDGPDDEVLARAVSRLPQARLWRGPEEDVLARYYTAARRFRARAVVRITADCPLLCPAVSEAVVEEYLNHRAVCDYASNTVERTFPIGLDTEVFSFEALETAYDEATDPAEREHVTPFIRGRRRFRLRSVVGDEDLSRLRWTVDTAEDLSVVKRIYELLYPQNPEFEFGEILASVRAHPDWQELNRHVKHREVRPRAAW